MGWSRGYTLRHDWLCSFVVSGNTCNYEIEEEEEEEDEDEEDEEEISGKFKLLSHSFS